MAGIDDILKNLPIDDIARTLGVDSNTAEAAIREGGQTILTGLKKGAETPDGAVALTHALDQHVGDKKVASTADIDEADGKSILGHVFGGQQEQVAANLGSSGATSGIDFAKLLPLLAPIIMNYIANQKKGQEAESSGGGLDIGGLLGGILGGGSSSGGNSSKKSGGFDIMGVLGGLFGKK